LRFFHFFLINSKKKDKLFTKIARKIGKQKTALNFGRTFYPNWQKQSVEKK